MLVWGAESLSACGNSLRMNPSPNPGKGWLSHPFTPNSVSSQGCYQQQFRFLMGQGRRPGSIMGEVMRTNLQRMEQVSGEESDGHQLVDWTPRQVEGLGTRFIWPAPGVLGKKVGKEANVLTERRMATFPRFWGPPGCPIFSSHASSPSHP